MECGSQGPNFICENAATHLKAQETNAFINKKSIPTTTAILVPRLNNRNDEPKQHATLDKKKATITDED